MMTNVFGKESPRRNFILTRNASNRVWNDVKPHYDVGVRLGWWSATPAALPAVDTAGETPQATVSGTQNAARQTDTAAPAPLGGRTKRLADVVIALCALALASPIMLMVFLLIRATMGGPAVYSHIRVGFDGKPFSCRKFRTMVANSDEVLREFLARDPEAARQWAEIRKLKNDPRITFLGRILRKSSLDELPQLFNVLRGEMSCVGPRPIVADELSRYEGFAADYLAARPGITGLWQVTGRSSTDYSSRVALDSQYVRNWSLWSDLVILSRTVFAVMRFDEAS
jgi:exopolysaccharide production protein ExoY